MKRRNLGKCSMTDCSKPTKSRERTMTQLYKLTDQNWRTRAGKFNECQWGENITHGGTGEGELCGPGWIHAYTDPLLAVFFNPIHAQIESPILWIAEGEIAINDHGVKVGCKTLTTKKIVNAPEVAMTNRIAFGILCAMQVYKVYKDPGFRKWATKWIDGSDRTSAAAYAAYAAYAASSAAAYAAANAANAANAAAYAAAYAVKPAAYAANAASNAASNAATYAAKPLDLIALAQRAMGIKK